MISKIKNFIIIFLLGCLFANTINAKYDRITKLYRTNYTTHLYSYHIPYEWYRRQLTEKNLFIIYGGSTSSDEFAYYRFINIYQQLNDKISFQYEHLAEDNPDYTKTDNILELNYNFYNLNVGLIGNIARDKEYVDIGYKFGYKNDDFSISYRLMNKKFQYNRKAKRPLEIKYEKNPIEHNIIIIKNNLLNNKLDIIFNLDFSNESLYKKTFNNSFHKERYLNIISHNKWRTSYAKNFIHSIRLLQNETKDYFETENEQFNSTILKNEFRINEFNNYKKFSIGLNYMFNKTNYKKNDFTRNKTENLNFRKQAITCIIEYEQFENEIVRIFHTLYNTWTYTRLNQETVRKGYYIKYTFESKFKLNNRSYIITNIGLEKKERNEPAFGGGCMKILINF